MAEYQSFELPDHAAQVSGRLAALRGRMQEMAVDGLLIPRADPYLGESVAPADERLAWATGFTGSAGLGLLLAQRAMLFVDGRYLVQAGAQTDPALFEIIDIAKTTPSVWMQKNFKTDGVLAYDPDLHAFGAIRSFAKAGMRMLAVDRNPVDMLWKDRPARPCTPARLHPQSVAGETAAQKCARIGTLLSGSKADAGFLASSESVNWLLNLRGEDVPHTPVVQAWALLAADGSTTLFLDPNRISAELRRDWNDRVRIVEPTPDVLATEFRRWAGRPLAMDPDATPERIHAIAEASGARVIEHSDPVLLPRACKNAAEIAGMREAHQMDGVAMAGFLAWLDAREPSDLTEIAIVDALEGYRRDTGGLIDIAFDTIAGSGPNAALPHYRVTRASDRALRRDEFLLVDSGGQYLTGTTDVTRTIALGEVSPKMRAAYTLVLRGMLTLARQRFPEGTPGIALDAIARQVLWQAGHDYPHGTGHGVGACLAVHEGPFRLSNRGKDANRTLKSGAVLSNEPGFYLPGSFGVRIENLLLVGEPQEIEGGTRPMHDFECLTLVPIDTRPIETGMLSEADRQWLDAYHARVFHEIGPHLETDAQDWLERACTPL